MAYPELPEDNGVGDQYLNGHTDEGSAERRASGMTSGDPEGQTPMSVSIHDLLIRSPPQPRPPLELFEPSAGPSSRHELDFSPAQGIGMPLPTHNASSIQPTSTLIDPKAAQSAASLTSSEASSPKSNYGPADLPRVGGWLPPRRTSRQVTPPLVIPQGWQAQLDPDDQPVMEGLGGAHFNGRSWVEVRSLQMKQEEADRKNSAPTPRTSTASSSPASSRSAAIALRNGGAMDYDDQQHEEDASFRKTLKNGLSSASLSALPITHARSRITLELHQSQSTLGRGALLEDLTVLIAQGAVPLQDPSNVASSSKSVMLPSLDPKASQYFVLGDADSPLNKLVLICDAATFSFDVVELPNLAVAALTQNLHAVTEQGLERENTMPPKRRRIEADAEPSALETQAKSAAVIPPESDILLSLQAERDTLASDLGTLRTQLSKSQSELSSSEARNSAAEEESRLLRSLYDQRSSAARVAMAEASDLEDQVSKLQRQLDKGLEAHQSAFASAREQWQQREKWLDARIRLLEEQSARIEERSPNMRRDINEWKVWKIAEEERLLQAEAKAKAKRERAEERRRELAELQAEELAALREEAMEMENLAEARNFGEGAKISEFGASTGLTSSPSQTVVLPRESQEILQGSALTAEE